MGRSFYVLVAFAVALPPVKAQALRVTGISDEQVLQRDSNERADVKIMGAAEKANNKIIEYRVWHKDGVLIGFDWKPTGPKVQRNKWSGEIRGLPTGGPYRIDFRVAGSRETTHTTSINNVLVGDIWVLAGQSNMQGVGNLEDVQQGHELIHSFDMTDRWLVAEEPLHTLVNAVDKVHWPRDADGVATKYEGEKLMEYVSQRKKGAGLGLAFAVQMLHRTGVPIALLPCAHGGTSMDQWSPRLKDQMGDSLYGSMIRRIAAVGGRIKGVLWYQGESDAHPKAAADFQTNFENFVTALRRDVGQQDLPFYYVQLGRHISSTNIAEWNTVQDAQLRAERNIQSSGMVAAVDAELDDGIHIGTSDLKRLGTRLANLACKNLFQKIAACEHLQTGPRPESVEVQSETVRVKFSGVNGKLTAPGRIGGFSIHSGTGELAPVVYRVEFDPSDGNTVILHTQGKMPEGGTVRYGAGKDPYCNVRDEADMAVPAFIFPLEASSPSPALPTTGSTEQAKKQ